MNETMKLSGRMKSVRYGTAMIAVLAAATLGHGALPGTSARAQSSTDAVIGFKTAGPVALNHNESALIGLLLPAVQHGATPYKLQIFTGSGKLLADVAIPGTDMRHGAFFQIYFADGSVKVVDRSTGEIVARSTQFDGVFSTILLPAVQSNGRAVGPIAASVELLTGTQGRGQIVGMCDGSV